MKKIVVILWGVLMLGACHNYKKDAQQLTLVKDSLQQQTAFKDSSIVELLSGFNEIQANLDSIKKLEKLVTVQSKQGGELSNQQKDQILEDIALLNNLLQRNKDLAASLQKKLKGANSKISELEGTIKQLKMMLDNLEYQVQEKDGEIVALTNEVQKLNIDISSLNEKIMAIETENRQKAETIENQTVQINTAYYVFGSIKELKDNGIIEKKGGVLGVGKIPTMKKDFNRDYFTEIDIRDFKYLPLQAKKARMVTVHPEGSFHFSGEKTADTLFVDRQNEFWKASKYLVIITD